MALEGEDQTQLPDLVAKTLETYRHEAVRRLEAAHVPLQSTILHTTVASNEQNTGFAIALEAALLGGTDSTSELAYKFSLYGALFLRDELDPHETFQQLRNIYRVRSKLVHGGRIKETERTRALADAPKLTTALIRRALESGWPEPMGLDAVALAVWGGPDEEA